MFKIYSVIFVWAISCFAVQPEHKPAVAVLELEGNGITNDEKSIFTNRLRSKLINTGNFTVIERNRMDEILKEQGFQKTGCTDNECAIEIGRLLNVKYIITGNLDKLEDLYTIAVRLVDVETGEITKSVDEDCKGCSIQDALLKSVTNAADKLAGKEVAPTLSNSTRENNSTVIEYRIISHDRITEKTNANSNVNYIEPDKKCIPKLVADKHSIAFWRFNEILGDSIKDESGNDHTIRLKGYPTLGDGWNGKSISFKNNYAISNNSTDFYPSVITVEACVFIEDYPDGSSSPVPLSMIISTVNWDFNTYGYELRIKGDGKPEFTFGTGSTQWISVSASGSLKKKEWYHVAGQFDGDTAKIFVNGKCEGVIAHHGRIGSSQTDLGIAKRIVDQPFYYSGKIDDLRISDIKRY